MTRLKVLELSVYVGIILASLVYLGTYAWKLWRPEPPKRGGYAGEEQQ